MTAASLGFIHTAIGPDHYLPFIVLSRARKWSRARTLAVTLVCGIGHVGSSVLIGMIGVLLGSAVGRLTSIESYRGEIAAWSLIVFGALYAVWGLRQAYRGHTHSHLHFHSNGEAHEHDHDHNGEHMHVHDSNEAAPLSYKELTPWILFIVFVLGPCEPLIPLLIYPAATVGLWGCALVAAVFSLVTVGTMCVIVTLVSEGFRMVQLNFLEKYSHALAGFAIFASGMAIQFLGL